MIEKRKSILKQTIKITIIGSFSNPDSTNLQMYHSLSRLPGISKVDKYDYRESLKKKTQEQLMTDFLRIGSTSDVCIICKGNNIPIKIIRTLRSTRSIVFLWFMDWYPQLVGSKYVLDYSRLCHYRSATGFETSVKWSTNIRMPVHHILDGFDPKTFYPEVKTKIWDVSFIGGADNERLAIKNYLQSKGFKVNFSGPRFNTHKNHKEMRDIMNQSKIVLNISRGNLAGYSSVRLWYILGSGAFTLTKHIPGMTTHMGLEDGIHIDSFKNMIDLETKVNYYLKNPEIRNTVAENGYRYALENQTWDHVVQRILDTINNYQAVYMKV